MRYRPVPLAYTFKPEIIESSFVTKVKKAAFSYLDVYYPVKYVPRMYAIDGDIMFSCSLEQGLLPIYGYYSAETIEIVISFMSFLSDDNLNEEILTKVVLHEIYHVFQEKQGIRLLALGDYPSAEKYRFSPLEVAANKFAISFFSEFKKWGGEKIKTQTLPDPGQITFEDLLKSANHKKPGCVEC